MKWFILVIGLVVVCFVAALLLGLVTGGMGAPTSSLRHEPLPDTPLTDDDLDALQLDVTARGYRMSEVDAVIGRLRRELREKDEQIAVLMADLDRPVDPGSSADPGSSGGPSGSTEQPEATLPPAGTPEEEQVDESAGEPVEESAGEPVGEQVDGPAGEPVEAEGSHRAAGRPGA